ncbi:TonB-dependent receptor [Pedobacter sp. BMA]|uniref:TonB-dependent receptor n=1 Tax=Pedobacter sp. BMA TaxID=1663685 RepID=UPI00064A0AA1|nr:TonB-dependent receptor [Pedobacter sp. BMA]KLT66540.1 TonB-dependent receptor [Pedobacter sp. BMA]
MKILFTSLLLFISYSGISQIVKTDSSAKKLDEVVVKGYYNTQPLLRSVSAVNLIDSSLIRLQNSSSLVSTFNTVPGVRMEERSPGSYRLSLRGSLLRSPFGIRNIKIYMDDFPLTDAGGNTYLNALDFASVASLEIYKGPESSIYGANTGGAVLISPVNLDHDEVGASITGGSYGLLHQTFNVQHKFKNYSFSLTQGYQQSDGYRENSAMKRAYLQTNHNWNYSSKGTLKLFALYSDLTYKTPGGLTAVQLEQNPRMARPATPTIPGAVMQQAGIYNKTTFAGLSNTFLFNEHLKHVIAVFGSYTDFKNPFITNYEKRYESTLGLRTFLEYKQNYGAVQSSSQIGFESSSTGSDIQNFNNAGGMATTMQAADHLKAKQNFAYLRFNFDVSQKLLIELASSVNFFSYKYESFFPTPIGEQQRSFDAEWMPKIAASYLLMPQLTVRASVSKGYSPPTVAEVRSSDNNINNNLQAELGWNYEAGLRYSSSDNRFYVNANMFRFNLDDAIVRRLNQNDAEYFINAGGTRQQGIELETTLWLIKKTQGFLTGLQWRSSYTFSNFKFNDFVSGSTSYSGNKLTGVPDHILINSLEFDLKEHVYLFIQHNHTSALPLNDANTVVAKKYDLVEAKAGIRKLNVFKIPFDVFFGVNNLLNEKYSLGNDLNAANGRYFNQAAETNFYGGIAVKL